MTFWRRLPPRRQAWLLGLVVLLVALLPRLYGLASTPPGLSGDEIFNAVDAQHIGQRWPVFIEGNNGREALFFYLMALSIKLFGLSRVALRLPAALLGAGSACLAYWLGRDRFNNRVGVAAGLLTAVSLWPLIQSHWALRAISLTFFTALTVYAFTRAWETGRTRTWLLAGVSLGLTMYTYIPSRAFPLVILGWLVWLFWQERAELRRQGRAAAASLGLALLVFAPYGRYMVNNPDIVNQRVGGLQTALNKAVNDGDWAALGESVGGVLRMFSFVGDTEWRYHVAGQPVFDPVTSIFFYLGLSVALLALLGRWDGRSRRPAYFVLLLWLAGMLGPVAILEANASFLRAAGAIVPVYLLAALGFDAAYQFLRARWPRLAPYAWVLAGLGLALILGRTGRDYFGLWSNNPEVRGIYNAGLGAAGDYLAANPPPAGTRVFTAYDYVYDVTTTLAYRTYTDTPTSWFAAEDSFVWAPDSPSWYLETVDYPLLDAVARLDAAETEAIPFGNGDPALTRYALPAGLQWAPAYELPLSFSGGPDLLGYDLPETLTRGETVSLITHWQIPAGRSGLDNELIFVQVILDDADGNRWGAWDGLFGYPQQSWQEGDRVAQRLEITVPEGMPPGPAYLRFDLRTADARSLPALDGTANNRGPAHLLRTQPLVDFQPAPTMPVFGDDLVLRTAIFSSLVAPGVPLDIALDWLPLAVPAENYRVQLSLNLPGQPPFVSQVYELWPDTYPPTQWAAYEPVTTLHRLFIPLDLAADPLPELRVNVLPAGDDAPLPLTQGFTKLGDLTVDARQRLFDVPPIAVTTDAQFGPAIRLLGYDLDESDARPGGQLRLTLYWQALATPAANYTVFNHLIGPDGNLAGQFDSPPVGAAWLTQTWLPGEVVVDERVVPIEAGAPAGIYRLAVGLYDSDVVRLSVVAGGEPQAGDQLVLTEIQLAP